MADDQMRASIPDNKTVGHCQHRHPREHPDAAHEARRQATEVHRIGVAALLRTVLEVQDLKWDRLAFVQEPEHVEHPCIHGELAHGRCTAIPRILDAALLDRDLVLELRLDFRGYAVE
jgi:hypothetical protein